MGICLGILPNCSEQLVFTAPLYGCFWAAGNSGFMQHIGKKIKYSGETLANHKCIHSFLKKNEEVEFFTMVFQAKDFILILLDFFVRVSPKW